MKNSKRIQIRGKVQGVFFRKSAKEKARQLEITGWVRNEPDGSVLTEIEGSPYAVQQMENWLQTGPENAQVEEVIIKEVIIKEGDRKDYTDFKVKK